MKKLRGLWIEVWDIGDDTSCKSMVLLCELSMVSRCLDSEEQKPSRTSMSSQRSYLNAVLRDPDSTNDTACEGAMAQGSPDGLCRPTVQAQALADKVLRLHCRPA